MKSHFHIVVIALASVLALCVTLAPGKEEQAAMLARDGLLESASKKLEILYEAGNREPHILMQLARLREQLGQPQEAVEALTDYLANFPKGQQAHESLARLYLGMHEENKAISAYETLNALDPGNERYVKDLLALYRKNRLSEQELKLLKSRSVKTLDLEETYRLAVLLKGAKDINGAIEALIIADGRAPLQEEGPLLEKEFRVELFNLLLEASHPSRAAALAAGWCDAWKSKVYLQTFAKRLAQTYPDEALNFAKLAAQKNSGAALQAAEAFKVASRPDLTTEALRQWTPKIVGAKPELVRDFVFLANGGADSALPLRVLNDFMIRGVKPGAIANLAEEVAKQAGMAALSSLQVQMPIEALQARPLFGARFSLAAGNAMLAQNIALGVDPAKLSEEELRDWLALVTELMGRDGAFEHLTALKANGALTDDAYAALVEQVSQGASDADAEPKG